MYTAGSSIAGNGGGTSNLPGDLLIFTKGVWSSASSSAHTACPCRSTLGIKSLSTNGLFEQYNPARLHCCRMYANISPVSRSTRKNCVPKTGRFLDDDDFVMYVETEEEKEKPKYVLTGNAKLALTDYYDAVHMLCEAQQNFAKSTQVLEKKIEDKSVFLDIIKQVQLPSVQVQVRTVEEMEKMEGKTYRELTLMCHLPNFKSPQRQGTNQNDGRIHLLHPV